MNCGNTYYFIDDCNDICKCKNGVQKEFSEKLELLDLIDDINEIIDENEQLKARIQYLEQKIQRERASAMKQHEKWEKELRQ